jgi:hypothetical protein
MIVLVWLKGGEAELAAFDGEAITVISTISSPPGSRLEATFGSHRAWMKVHQCKKQPDGRFLLQGRAFDMVREARTALLQGAQARARD